MLLNLWIVVLATGAPGQDTLSAASAAERACLEVALEATTDNDLALSLRHHCTTTPRVDLALWNPKLAGKQMIFAPRLLGPGKWLTRRVGAKMGTLFSSTPGVNDVNVKVQFELNAKKHTLLLRFGTTYRDGKFKKAWKRFPKSPCAENTWDDGSIPGGQ